MADTAQTTEIPEALLDQLTRRGWAITRLGQSNGYWFGSAEFLPGGPLEPRPEFGFRVYEGSREACVEKLRTLIAGERAKGLWTEVADGE